MKLHLFLIVSATFSALASLIIILFFIDPSTADYFLLTLFYTCLFISVGGLVSLLGIALRKGAAYPKRLSVSFRQGAFFAVVLVVLFLMKDAGLLHLWTAILLVGGVVGAEMYLLYK